jgi:NAD(P)-dependent dehydrogenase (short-subunit alcohol dehydrogenase family)
MRSSELFNVTGQVALVTGAASGLGLSMSEVLGANGARVIMIDVDETRLASSVGRLQELGVQAEGVVLDVSDAEAVKRVIGEISQRHSRLDIAMLNAGISGGPGFDVPAGQIENVHASGWGKVLDVNLSGTFFTLQTVAGIMKKQRSGRIVVTSSMAGIRSQPSIGYSYIASKAAVAALIRQTALELAPFDVQINGIAPGPFSTQIGEGRINSPEVAQHFAAMTPLNRVASAEEIKGVTMFLSSRASSFMTGAVVPVDGGMSAA